MLPVILASGIFFNVNQASKYSLVPRILQSLANVCLVTECDDGAPPTLCSSASLLHNPHRPHDTSSFFVLSGQLIFKGILRGSFREISHHNSAELVQFSVRQIVTQAESLAQSLS